VHGVTPERGATRQDELWWRVYQAVRQPPAAPFRRDFWRSPLRGPWLTSALSTALLVGIPVMFVTGLISYAAYNPRLAGNNTTPNVGVLGFYLFSWTTSPSWIYRVSQGIHVLGGLALVPILLAKLWSVMPKLFSWPPFPSAAKLLERLSLILLVGGVMFEFFTGIFNIDYFYLWTFSFYDAHLYGAWAFMAGFVIHVGLKLPTMVRSLRARSLTNELRTGLAGTLPEPADDTGLVPTNPSAPTISRRGLLALVGGTSLAVVVATAGENAGGWFRRVSVLAPRGRSYGNGPNDFQVNKPAAAAGIKAADVGSDWRLDVVGATHISLSRAELMALPQFTQTLPIACVEGWATVQRWTGVPLADLARLAGVSNPVSLDVESLERPGEPFRSATLSGIQTMDPRSLLALCVNGVDLSLDHGYPARTIIPAAPGVHNTKWVRTLTFVSA
jgi:DMSO/TMAO reductase YedYZ molybdopterin-dependent catalytic subunit